MATKHFECPNCNAPGEITISPIVRVSETPEAKARVLCGTYFEWECPSCGRRYLFDDVFLYYDDIKNFMVYYVPGFKNKALPVPTLIRTKDGFDWRSSTLRVTARFLDLAEKIRILDAGFDDRVVEAVKYYCHVNFAKTEQPAQDILFEELDEDGTLFFSVYRGDNCIGLPVPMDMHQRVKADLANLIDTPPEDMFIMVDQRWLADILGDIA